MPEVIYQPITKIVVHEIVELDVVSLADEVIRSALAQQLPIQPTVNWTDGVAFVAFPLDTEEAEKDRMEGILHFGSIIYSKTPFQNEVKVKIGKEELSVRLRKTEYNPTFRDLASFLREFRNGSTESIDTEKVIDE